MFVC